MNNLQNNLKTVSCKSEETPGVRLIIYIFHYNSCMCFEKIVL